MRRIRYTEHGVGPTVESEGDIADLLASIPGLLTDGLIPPLHVLNVVLRRGEEEAGMSGGCNWEPFELNAEEFDELIDELEARPPGEAPLRFVEPPKWVRTPLEFRLWCADYLLSIPYEQNRKLVAELEGLEAGMRKAEATGDHDLEEELSSKLLRAVQAYGEFVRRARKPPGITEK